jgi:galactitol-specific phosphotransferase system IIC component
MSNALFVVLVVNVVYLRMKKTVVLTIDAEKLLEIEISEPVLGIQHRI